MIIMNEKEFVEKMLSNYEMLDKPYICLRLLAKYYLSIGYNKPDTSRLLENFLQRNDKYVNLFWWQHTIDESIKYAKRHPMIELTHISITEHEMTVVRSFGALQMQMLAFTILCLAKYRTMVDPARDFWVSYSQSEIFSMANLTVKTERQCAMLRQLFIDGFITYSKRIDSTNFRCNYASDDSPVSLSVTDMRHLGNQYRKYIGEPYVECEVCGAVVRKRSNRQKYCPKCAADIAREKEKERLQQLYAKKKLKK